MRGTSNVPCGEKSLVRVASRDRSEYLARLTLADASRSALDIVKLR
jgi:hypothetical protein